MFPQLVKKPAPIKVIIDTTVLVKLNWPVNVKALVKVKLEVPEFANLRFNQLIPDVFRVTLPVICKVPVQTTVPVT